jgi:hypothetical protein
MTMLSIVSPGSIPVVPADSESSKAVALFCMLGLVASLCLMTFGVDLSAGMA